MIDLSLAGLIGAMAGTVVAAVMYYVSIGVLDQAMRARTPSPAVKEEGAADISWPIIRRVVLAVDLLFFAALGYWLGQLLGD